MEETNYEKKTERALLISVDTGDFDAEASINELAELADTAGAEVIGMIVQKRMRRLRPPLSARADFRKYPLSAITMILISLLQTVNYRLFRLRI